MIKFIEGDLLESKADVILHQVNNKGKFATGVAGAIRKKYPKVYDHYIKRYNETGLELGTNIWVDVKVEDEKYITVINMIAQDGYGYDGKRYTNYGALANCLYYIAMNLIGFEGTIALPFKMSCERGGADWSIVFEMIKFFLNDYNVEIWRLDAN